MDYSAYFLTVNLQNMEVQGPQEISMKIGNITKVSIFYMNLTSTTYAFVEFEYVSWKSMEI